MGPVRSLIESLDNQKEMQSAAKQAVQIALQMLNTRFRSFEAEINNPVGPVKKLPSQYLVTFCKTIVVNISKNQDSISNEISNIVDSFVSGNIKQGVCNILHSALDTILGSYSAGYNEAQNYVVIANHMGGIYRIDYLVVQQKMRTKGITEKFQDVFGSYLIVSSIQRQTILDDNVFRIIVDRQFTNRTLKEKFLIMKLLKGQQLSPDEFQQIQNMPAEPARVEMLSLKAPAEIIADTLPPVVPTLAPTPVQFDRRQSRVVEKEKKK